MKPKLLIISIFVVAITMIVAIKYLLDISERKKINLAKIYETEKKLKFLSMCFDSYLTDKQKPPSSLIQIIYEFEKQAPSNWINTGYVTDAWGNTIDFIDNGKNYILRSYGPNAVSDEGKEDDIELIVTIP